MRSKETPTPAARFVATVILLTAGIAALLIWAILVIYWPNATGRDYVGFFILALGPLIGIGLIVALTRGLEQRAYRTQGEEGQARGEPQPF